MASTFASISVAVCRAVGSGFFSVPSCGPSRAPRWGPSDRRIVPGMAITSDPITQLVDHVEARGRTSSGRLIAAGWGAAVPLLGGWMTAGDIAAFCRTADGPAQDRLIGAVLTVAAGQELAQLTVVAGLAGRLRSVVAGWVRAGVPSWELPGMAADLVSGCWKATAELAGNVSAGAPLPRKVSWYLVDEAREQVRVPRRRERRAAARQIPISSVSLTAVAEPRVADRLAVVISDAVRSGRIGRQAAIPVFLTRVAGFEVAETAARLGCSPAVVRAVRSRAERRLVPA